MDSMDSIHRVSRRRAPSRAFSLLAAAVLTVLLAPAAAAPAAKPALAVPADASAATSAALEPLLTGEFALQAGKLKEAATAYAAAARAAKDKELAARATDIAIVAKEDKLAAESLALWRQLGGDGAPLLASQAILALRGGDERAALRDLDRLMLADDTGWRRVLGVLSTGSKDPAQAARLLEKLVDGSQMPTDLMAWVAFGLYAQRLDQPKLTERIVGEVVQRFPGNPRVSLLRASQLREDGKSDEARKVLESIAGQADTDTQMRGLIAQEYDALGDLPAASAILGRGPQDDQTYALRASLLARAEDKPTLTQLYDELRRNAAKPEPGRRLLLGQIAEFLERNDEALDWYRGVPGGPQRWIARLRAANVLHELKRGDEAYAALRALQADASAEDDTRRDAYLLEAALRAEDKNEAGELDAFARGLAAFPDEPEVLYARALSYERRDDIPRAEADFRRILVAEPDSVAALNALGYTLADRTTRYQEALELIQRARTAEPDNAAIIDSYGWVLYRLGRNEEALVELRRALTLQKDPEIASHLAEVLWAVGKKDEARKYFEQARKLDPDNRALKRALEKTGA
ncbi:tetratricopeptide repeat protein [Lysobacter sp. 5GHs7-4]|uniref:tetratricopeptide repeat protein n=1 Tax=Lysobacter sp. 5GHs7-4 TaxID=2904253 RepID=UPI001E2E51E3|nr:tetratricopeptide repeat protein [Lysobacter sp. 5GHs7-4]UHQ24348.1 tetratricopeptide repeat protein [Lysobacter sp. 5GHs7-4]